MRSGSRGLLLATALMAVAAWTCDAAVAAAPAPDYSPPPGADNPQVTQATITRTICVRGWTRTVRPPYAYTEALKREQIAARHLPGSVRDYEEDHFIPLELGGSPTDPNNLWPQPWPQARRKDGWELSLNRAVCSGRMSLADARRKVADPTLWR